MATTTALRTADTGSAIAAMPSPINASPRATTRWAAGPVRTCARQ